MSSSLESFIIRPYETSDATALIDLWNAHLGALHPLTPALFAQTTARHFDPAWVLVAEREGSACGFVGAKPAPWGTAFGAHLWGIAVDPTLAGRGVGSRLWAALTDTLRADTLKGAGVTRLRIGGEPRQLLPGVPQGASLATWRFLRARGVRFGGLEHDLHVDLGQVPEIALPTGYRCGAVTAGDALADELVAFVEREFPGRWAAEVKERLEPTHLLALTDPQHHIIGFASTFYQNRYIGPSLNWVTSLSESVTATSAGLGPIGLAADVRGQGLGLAFLIACAHNLRDRGAQHLFIDWTTLVDFYARIGAHVWRTYQSAYVDL